MALLRPSLSTLVFLPLLMVGCGDDGDTGDSGAVDSGVLDSRVDSGAPDTAPPPLVMLPDTREACADREPLKRPFFGDLHVHTALSFDAVTFDVRTRPRDVYAFARGAPLELPPYDGTGAATRQVTIDRPLDFAAVTEHSEFLAETPLCWTPGTEAYDSRTCTSYREGDATIGDFGALTGVFLTNPPRRPPLCILEPELCAAALGDSWTEIMDAAEEAYDRTSACEFTSFVGYEWTGAPAGSNIHRNVIFRSRTVPSVPTSYVEASRPEPLWDAIDRNCRDASEDCDALIIPHNSNLGASLMFVPEDIGGDPYDEALATRRAAMEPIVEIYQHKGASECFVRPDDPLGSEDELCNFEQMHADLCTGAADDSEDCVDLCSVGGGIGFLGGCVEPGDFVRGALRNGLSELRRVGANPFQFGFIGSTDFHNGNAGGTAEDAWPGAQGDSDDDPEEALKVGGTPLVRGFTASPGGLAVIWAEENTREALFDNLRAREAYATSGTRIILRFFGGFGYAADLCDDPDLVTTGYADGVPMGGELTAAPAGTAPSFVLSALRDAMGTQLQRIQVIKGWIDAAGVTHEEVYEVGGDPMNGATVDTASCTPAGPGADALCSVWTDPDFDAAEAAFYYARVIENPTCRWSQYLCNDLSVDCATLSTDSPYAACCDSDRAQTIQERAWSSPIWYTP
ncbi:MAG: hypothetical protein DRJ42_15780 [Deltaproteobacteria bacterium]|nr:MAG: hypothetical protein DRJ42_15780 [Deltaproteobacteria bacterium]